MRNVQAIFRAARHMGNPTATLERAQKSAMNVPASQIDEAERPRAGGIRFTYPSGSRPLEGYTIKRGVGRGGFGEVYFATSDAGKEVALKLIRRNLEVELRGVTQCLNVKHPNLVGVYDIRSDTLDDQWVIMEYVSGESLEDIINRHPNGMPIDQVLAWMRGICAGVAYLHDHGIVHRDLKPGNIFLDEGTVKIGDYGLAKFISCSRRSGQTESVGTVHYMAPEIANGRYGREIDTYALGIILFEMLTGTVPFEGESVGEVLMKHLTAEPDLERLEQPYREIVRKALAKDPEARLKSVNELVSMLPGDFSSVISPAGFAPSHVSDVVLVPAEPREKQFNEGAAVNGVAPKVATPKGAAAKLASAAAPAAAATPAADIEEPIWRAVRDNWDRFWANWHGQGAYPMNPLAKGLMVFGFVIGCIYFAGTVFEFAIPVLICYGVYYLVWVSVLKPSGVHKATRDIDDHVADQLRGEAVVREDAMTAAWHPPAKPPASPASRYAEKVRARRARASWRDRVNQELVAKPARDKFTELFGSMLSSAMFASLAALVAPVLMGVSTGSGSLAVYLWLAIVGTLGSWAVLVPTKFVEGKLEDQGPIRVAMLLVGGLVGAAAWFLADALIVTMPSVGEPIGANWGFISHELLQWNRGTGPNPSLPSFVTYFAFLFVLLRWWKQAEFTRNSRLSLWTVVACVFWAWLLQFFWAFPQPAGMLVAGVVAFATQLSSPWLPPSRRKVLVDDAELTA
jgi:hypothetical protein